MKLSRRNFLCSPAIAAMPLPDKVETTPYSNGDIVHPRLIDGVTPLEGEFITLFKSDPIKGMGIFEGQYREGKFYMRDFSRESMPFTVEIEPDSWNETGGYFPDYAVAKIKTMIGQRLSLAQLAELTK